MHCFNHQDRPAVGLCKSCGKALCPECLAEVPDGLACRNACEERVMLMNRLMDINVQMIPAAKAQLQVMDIMGLVLGVVLLVLAFYTRNLFESPLSLILGGAGVLVLLQAALRRRKKYRLPGLE